MIRIVLTISAVALGATAVLAQNLAPIKERQEIMKKSNDELKMLTAMSKGEAPFDARKATATYGGMEGAYKKVQTLFPDDSKTGEKTRAAPKVWENKADFDSKMAAFIKVAGDAKAKATTEAGLKEIHPAVIKACDNCHEQYRLRRQ